MTAHHFVADGYREDGEPRLRCARCGMLGHWAGARDACPYLCNARYRVHATPSAPQPVVQGNGASTHWEGPYAKNRWSTCARCSARFRHPKRFRVMSFCGPMCARDNQLDRNRADAAAYRARQAQESRS